MESKNKLKMYAVSLVYISVEKQLHLLSHTIEAKSKKEAFGAIILKEGPNYKEWTLLLKTVIKVKK